MATAPGAYVAGVRRLSRARIAARYQHRLVQIHVFANGNGRHARVMVDGLLRRWGKASFSWGSALPIAEARDHYLAALRAADGHDFGLLLEFLAD